MTAYASLSSALTGATSYTVQSYTQYGVYVATFINAAGRNVVVWSISGSGNFVYHAPSFTQLSITDVFGTAVPYNRIGNDLTFNITPAGRPGDALTSGSPVILKLLNYLLERDLNRSGTAHDNAPMWLNRAA
jgi:hypothetical protein